MRDLGLAKLRGELEAAQKWMPNFLTQTATVEAFRKGLNDDERKAIADYAKAYEMLKANNPDARQLAASDLSMREHVFYLLKDNYEAARTSFLKFDCNSTSRYVRYENKGTAAGNGNPTPWANVENECYHGYNQAWMGGATSQTVPFLLVANGSARFWACSGGKYGEFTRLLSCTSVDLVTDAVYGADFGSSLKDATIIAHQRPNRLALSEEAYLQFALPACYVEAPVR
jgi:hypothetical protein